MILRFGFREILLGWWERSIEFRFEFRPGSRVNPGGRPNGINRGVRANFGGRAAWEDGGERLRWIPE